MQLSRIWSVSRDYNRGRGMFIVSTRLWNPVEMAALRGDFRTSFGMVRPAIWPDLPLNCPKCWRPMRDLHVRAADGTIIDVATATDADVHVDRCAEHGPFHFSRDIPVRMPS